MLFYRIADTRFDRGYRFLGLGTRPLQDRFPDVEDILERCRPEHMHDRGDSVYLRSEKDFSRVGVTFSEGYIHTVDPEGGAERRDLVWTGVLQFRYYPDARCRKDLRPDLTDDEVAIRWWTGEATTSPNWEWIAKAAVVIEVDDQPVKVRPDSLFLNIFEN